MYNIKLLFSNLVFLNISPVKTDPTYKTLLNFFVVFSFMILKTLIY
jgi:hypothetical protein